MALWPDNKSFAFTIFDDTDFSTLDNAPLVYDFLIQRGLRTTKSVWIFDGDLDPDHNNCFGTTCEDPKYLAWTQSLQAQGVEIASHSTSLSYSTRNRIVAGLDKFKEYFGEYPKTLAQHNDSVENESIYWGPKRVSGIHQLIYKMIVTLKGKRRNIYFGEDLNSKFFWGDICQKRIKYMRNFVFPGINTLKACSAMPYHDPERPYVNYWFASTDASDMARFVSILNSENLDKLEAENGACIIYTHFGLRFVENGRLNPTFIKAIDALTNRNGWFVPVVDLLDFLLDKRKNSWISKPERNVLERSWLLHKFTASTT